MGTTLVRISDELKEELENCEGQNFDERIKNYNQGLNSDVNKNVNSSGGDVQELKELVEDVNNKLTELDVGEEVEKALPAGMFK